MNLPYRKTEAEPRELHVVDRIDPGGGLADVFADSYVDHDDDPGAWQPPAGPPQPQRPASLLRRVPWPAWAAVAVPVAGVLAYLIWLNAALFAVVAAITTIVVCGVGSKAAQRCRGDH